MMPEPDPMGQFEAPAPRPQRRRWPIVLAIVCGVLVFSCIGCVGLLAWFGARSPDIYVLTAHEVPRRDIETMEDIGVLDPGERLEFFYSDAVLDFTSGFSIVTNKKVAVYSQDANPPLIAMSFDEIVAAELTRATSWYMDSYIHLELDDGTPVSFPVTSLQDGDLRFFKAIEKRIEPTESDEP